MGDKIALRLLYIEAVYYVLKGWYPVTQQQAVKLGGLQLQAYVGDSNAAHAPGFLTTDQNWKNYVPKHLRHAIQPQDWEVVRHQSPLSPFLSTDWAPSLNRPCLAST